MHSTSAKLAVITVVTRVLARVHTFDIRQDG